MSSSTKKRFSSLSLLAGLFTISVNAGSVNAIVLNVNGTDYDITTFSGIYNTDTSKFQAPPLGVMPWWGNENLAKAFADAIGDGLGNPYVAWGYGEIQADLVSAWQWDNPSGEPGRISTNPSSQELYLKASLYQQPVPGPLPIFGAAAAFGMSRRLRRRIKGTNPSQS